MRRPRANTDRLSLEKLRMVFNALFPSLNHSILVVFPIGTIACWEADHSSTAWYDKVINGMRHLPQLASNLSFTISDDLKDKWISELLGQLPYYSELGTLAFWIENTSSWTADLLDWLRNKDDLVCENHYGWSREWLTRAMMEGNHVYLDYEVTVGFAAFEMLTTALPAFRLPGLVSIS